jgi:hypothetical protein
MLLVFLLWGEAYSKPKCSFPDGRKEKKVQLQQGRPLLKFPEAASSRDQTPLSREFESHFGA